MKESDLQKKVLKYLNSKGAWVVKTISTNKAGTPDILGCLNGKFFAIELKAPDKKPEGSPLQQYQISEIIKAGGHAKVLNSLDSVKEFIESC